MCVFICIHVYIYIDVYMHTYIYINWNRSFIRTNWLLR